MKRRHEILRLWASLYSWIFRRYKIRHSDFTYHKSSILGTAIIVVLVCFPIEIAVCELLIPWTWLRWVVFIVSIYALLWVIGFYASLVVHPYQIKENGILLRYGVIAEGYIPFNNIASVVQEKGRVPKKHRGLFVDASQSAAYFSNEGITNIVIRLVQPQSMQGFFTVMNPVLTVYLILDEPERFEHSLSL